MGPRCRRCFQPLPPRGETDRTLHCPRCDLTIRPDLELRSDLVIAPVQEDGGLYYVIKDPRAGRYFRVKPLEHFLITQFDGATSFETIRRRTSEAKGVLVSEEVLSRFAEKFRSLGLLVSGEDPPAPRALAGSSLLHLKLPLANPERLLERLYPWFRWCFSTAFVAIAGLSLLAAVSVVLTRREELVFGLRSVVHLEGLLFVLVTLSVVSVLHELAHGLCCRHFGGRVEDMGFLLLYFLPCFYCNVSDSYFFRAKRERIWVLFAGGFFELFLWAVAVLGWRVAAPGTFPSRVFFVVAAVCALRSLFNFNPLIKMDGYYMLSEWLDVRNLRREAISSLTRLVRRLCHLEAAPAGGELGERRRLGMREDRFLALFGGAALAYTALLVGTILFYGGSLVFESFGSDGLGFYAVALLGLLHKPALTAATAAREAGKEKWQKLGEKKRRLRFVLLWSGILLAFVFCPWELRIASDLSVLPQEREIVRAPAEGRILRIHAREGERIEENDLILEYDRTELELEKRTKEAELLQAGEQLRLLEKRNPTVNEEIRVKERALETARAQEEAARREHDRSLQLSGHGLISKEALERAENALEESVALRRQAEAEIELALKSSPLSRTEDMERTHLLDPQAQRARIEKLQAELARLQDLLERTKIYASISGTLTTYRFQEKVGDYLEEGAEVCEIANDDRVVVEMSVSEKDIDVIAKGQAVKFKVRGYPGRSFQALVEEIAPVVNSSALVVRAYVENEDKVLKPGMTGVAKIYCGTSFVGHILTRDIVRFLRTEFWL